MKKLNAFLIIALIVIQALHAQEVHIPDPHFLSALIEAGVDMDGSGTLEPEEAASVICLDISDKNIYDISGIGAFTSLTSLNCSRNYLTELDLSGNKSLETLCCAVNCLVSLDLSGNPELTELTCCFNGLTGLDLSNNLSLRFLDCSVNRLGSLDVSRNPVLEYLDCHDTKLEILHLKHNPSLEYLSCSFNLLEYLDLSENRSLTHLDCLCNGIRNLDVSKNRDLLSLSCSFNQLISLNISQNNSLEKLYCGYNLMKELDISTNPNIRELDISGMKMLTSLCVPATPFPPEGMKVYSSDCPNISIRDCQPPQLDLWYLQNDPLLIEVCLSEDGTVYGVAEGTGKDSILISNTCTFAALMTACIPRKVPVTSAMEGCLWLYAIDPAGNISDPLPVHPQRTGIWKDLDDRVNIYPNPFRDIVNITSRLPGKAEIRITDLKSVIVTKNFSEGNTLHLDLSTLPSGTYLMTIKSAHVTIVRKIIKF